MEKLEEYASNLDQLAKQADASSSEYRLIRLLIDAAMSKSRDIDDRLKRQYADIINKYYDRVESAIGFYKTLKMMKEDEEIRNALSAEIIGDLVPHLSDVAKHTTLLVNLARKADVVAANLRIPVRKHSLEFPMSGGGNAGPLSESDMTNLILKQLGVSVGKSTTPVSHLKKSKTLKKKGKKAKKTKKGKKTKKTKKAKTKTTKKGTKKRTKKRKTAKKITSPPSSMSLEMALTSEGIELKKKAKKPKKSKKSKKGSSKAKTKTKKTKTKGKKRKTQRGSGLDELDRQLGGYIRSKTDTITEADLDLAP